MIMSYVSDSVFYTDGTNYYCQVYFSPDEIVSLFPGVEHLYVVGRIREIDKKELYKLISWTKCQVDFINLEEPNGNILKRLAKTYSVSKRLNRISDISYLKFCFISSYIYGMQIKKKHKGKFYFSQMVGDPDCILSFSSSQIKKVFLSALNYLQKKCYAGIAKKMDLQIFVSHKLKEKYAVSSVKSIVANENRFRASDIISIMDIQNDSNTKPLKLLFVGRLSPEKRVRDLIAALRNTTDVSLSIIGDGPQKSELMALANEQKVAEKVFFLGRKKWGEELFTEMKKYDALILPSENEGLPLVIAEAMSCGLTVIASNVGGIPEIVKNDVNGILFEKGNVAMLEKSINRLKNPALRHQLVVEALKTAHAFSFDNQNRILKNELEIAMRRV